MRPDVFDDQADLGISVRGAPSANFHFAESVFEVGISLPAASIMHFIHMLTGRILLV